MGKAPGSDTPNALRWYNHIKSFNNDERKKFPAGTGFKTTSVNNVSNGKGDDDDDVDLFASDEEEVRFSFFFFHYYKFNRLHFKFISHIFKI